MTTEAVHWHEGMFLRPHHLQAAGRHEFHRAHVRETWDQHHYWGLREIHLDRDALGDYRLVIRSLKARLRDGTLVCVEEADLPQLDLKPAFAQSQELTVLLALPVLRVGGVNVAANGAAEEARYLLTSRDLADENTGLNAQPVQLRRLNFKLLLSAQHPTREDEAAQQYPGYTVLPLARIGIKERVPVLDAEYIPPLLGCDAWSPLQAGILQALYHQIGQRIDYLASVVASSGLTFDSHAPGDPEYFARLQLFNEAYALLGAIAFVPGLHPLPAYVELCRLVGKLAILTKTRRPPDLPRYDHDDLGPCFTRVKQILDGIPDLERGFEERHFIGAGLRMQVALESAWLEPARQMYIGVHSPLNPQECERLLTRQLDMKIGSSDRVDELYTRGMLGLVFRRNDQPPRVLPARPGLTYFEVLRQSQPEEWQHVQRMLTLAIRLNERSVVGDIQGKRVLTVRNAGQTTTLEFTLFVTREK